MGVVLWSGGDLTNNGVVVGGAGGATGIIGGGGGDGGAGVLLTAGGTVTNGAGASITGGVGGNGRYNATGPTSGGRGGAGVKGANITLVNAGTIAGAMGGTNTGGTAPVRAAAVQFTGGTNSLEIHAGATFTGDVIAFSAADTLKLGGVPGGSFDVATLGSAFRGFGEYEKVGTNTWTLTGATTAVTPWTIRQGLLEVLTDEGMGDASGRLTLAGGGLRLAGSFKTARAVTLVNAGSVIDTQGSDATFSGVLSGAGGLDKRGSSTLTLSGANTYAGDTLVTGGLLLINGDQSAATGLTTVTAGGALGGSGTIGGDVIVDGRLAPGNSPRHPDHRRRPDPQPDLRTGLRVRALERRRRSDERPGEGRRRSAPGRGHRCHGHRRRDVRRRPLPCHFLRRGAGRPGPDHRHDAGRLDRQRADGDPGSGEPGQHRRHDP
jgi:autotransporter-associated beta strand protein